MIRKRRKRRLGEKEEKRIVLGKEDRTEEEKSIV